MQNTESTYFFVSYVRSDFEIVRQTIEALQVLGHRFWVDYQDLQPGMNWEVAIENALEKSTGLLIFVSKRSLESEWVLRELYAALNHNIVVLPVLLESPISNMPIVLQEIQWLILNRDNSSQSIRQLSDALTRWARTNSTPGAGLHASDRETIAKETVAELTGSAQPKQTNANPPDTVFIVHGHDSQLLNEVDNFLNLLGVGTIILGNIHTQHQSLLQKFFALGQSAQFAVVLMSPDDRGASRYQYDKPHGVEDKALQFRARQNVILELGFFYGHLGFQNVFLLVKAPTVRWPNFEFPSDLAGVLYESVDPNGQWKNNLQNTLRIAGFAV